MGSYFRSTIATFTNTDLGLSTIDIGSPGIYLIRIHVQIQLATANVNANAYLRNIPGMSANTSLGFSAPFANGGFQTADVSCFVTVASTYSYQILMATGSSTFIVTNGITCLFSWVRIA